MTYATAHRRIKEFHREDRPMIQDTNQYYLVSTNRRYIHHLKPRTRQCQTSSNIIRRCLTIIYIIFLSLILFFVIQSRFSVSSRNNQHQEEAPVESKWGYRVSADDQSASITNISHVIPVTSITYLNNITDVSNDIGKNLIPLGDTNSLLRHDLPDVYYGEINYSYFQPYMCYSHVTNKKTSAYKISHHENAYTDEHGFRRFKTTPDQFTVDGKDDYMIALGNFYKEKYTCGDRYLIVTSRGMYTAIVGSEKDDSHTDDMNMFSTHGDDGQYAGVIEWIMDTTSNNIHRNILKTGTITQGPIDTFKGEILYIYEIQ